MTGIGVQQGRGSVDPPFAAPSDVIDLRELSPRQKASPWFDLILDGDPSNAYGGDRSRAAAAAAVGLVNAGLEYHDFYSLMTDPRAANDWAVRYSRKRGSRPRARGDIHKRLEHTWKKAVQLVKDKPARPDQSTVSWMVMQARALAESTAWGGQRGTTDRLVVAAMHALAEKHGKLVFFVDCRSLAEMVGIGHGTANRSLNRLAADEIWIRKTAGPTNALATTFRIVVPNSDAVPATGADPDIASDGSQADVLVLARHDAFAWKGLGRAAARILSALGDEGRSVEQLARQLGVHQRTVRRHLRELAVHGLATDRGEGCWARVKLDPDAQLTHLDLIAAEIGVTGIQARRREDHRRHREAHAQILDFRGREWSRRPIRSRAPSRLPAAA